MQRGSNFSSGRHDHGPIPPGRYTIRAVLADGRSDERKVRLRSRDTEKKVVLKLD